MSEPQEQQEQPPPYLTLCRNFDPPAIPTLVTEPAAVWKFMQPWIAKERLENFWVIPFSGHDRHLIGDAPIKVAMGGRESVPTEISDIMRAILLMDADGAIVVHNHPPGSDTLPSLPDLQSTQAVVLAAICIRLDVADHIIVTDREFTSIRDKFPELWPSRGLLEAYQAVAFDSVGDTTAWQQKARMWQKDQRRHDPFKRLFNILGQDLPEDLNDD